MMSFLFCILISIFFLRQPLIKVFYHNIFLNTLILSCLFLGLGSCFYKLFLIKKEQRCLDQLQEDGKFLLHTHKIHFLTPLLAMARNKKSLDFLSPLSAKTISSSVEARLDELRDTNRYLIALLVFLGLLGTFWGLAETIRGVSTVVNGISVTTGELKEAFHALKNSLQSPLSGMGAAFSCSMLGLVSSLMVGFFDLLLSKVILRFYYNVEEYLSIKSSLNASGVNKKEEEKGNGPSYSFALLEQTAEEMATLHSHIVQGENNRLELLKTLQEVSKKMEELTSQMLQHQTIIKKMAQNQISLQENFLQLKNPSQSEETLNNYMKNLDRISQRLLEEMIKGREQSTSEIRKEIRVVSKTLSAIANGQEVAA